MKLSKKVLDALNGQMKNEFYSHNLYLSMTAYFYGLELKGIAHWLKLQAKEEAEHAMKIFDYLMDRDAEIEILAIEGVKTEWNNPIQVFEQTLKHEEKVTEQINTLYDLAVSEKDHATRAFLEWFVKEQVEEEASAREVLAKVKLAESSAEGLLLLDRELGQRK